MRDQSHMNALRLNRSNEVARLANAKTEAERTLRGVWVAQLDREIAAEEMFQAALPAMSDDDLLRELSQ